MFDSSSSQLWSVLNWSQSSGEEVVDGLSVEVEFPISSFFDHVEEYDDCGRGVGVIVRIILVARPGLQL